MIDKLNKFLNKKSLKPKMIVIYWPTGSWKTSMSIDIAKEIDSEIIGADSRQIFKYLNIWTWKITEEEKKWVIHHMLDIITPNTVYSAWEFKREAEKIINNIYSKWKIPILCWWTGLYIDSLIYDFDIPKVPADEKIRRMLEEEASKYWNEAVYKKLEKLDPEYAKELHPNNIRYVIRAIEVKMLTWKSKTVFRKEKKLKYDVLFLTPYKWDREYLYNRINKRVGMMFDEWLVKEVKNLLKKWYKKEDFWMNSIWYVEVIDYLKWKLNLEETIELVSKHNRNYAKKQLTWFRKYENR
jgi:tRNA dimethylallyltransferase